MVVPGKAEADSLPPDHAIEERDTDQEPRPDQLKRGYEVEADLRRNERPTPDNDATKQQEPD